MQSTISKSGASQGLQNLQIAMQQQQAVLIQLQVQVTHAETRAQERADMARIAATVLQLEQTTETSLTTKHMANPSNTLARMTSTLLSETTKFESPWELDLDRKSLKP